MFIWNKENTTWFSRAAKESKFHKNLADTIKPFLNKDDSIISLGAGLGFLERELSKYVKEVTLVDNNKSAIEYAKKFNNKNINIINSNWNEINKTCDYLLLSFFSRLYIEKNLDNYFKFCNKSIFYIINERRSNIDEVISYLKECKVNYSYKRYSFDFNQRLKKDEIDDYINCYYKSYSKEKKQKLKKNIIKENDDFIFLNKKKIVLFVINKNKSKEF